MYSIFPNNILTNNAYKDKKDEMYHQELCELFNSIDEITTNGNCIGCGRRDSIKEHVKRDIPLTGSVSFKNFFSELDNSSGLKKLQRLQRYEEFLNTR